MSFVANTIIKHGQENGEVVIYQPGDTVPSEVAKELAETGAVSEVDSKQETTESAKVDSKQETTTEKKETTESAKGEAK